MAVAVAVAVTGKFLCRNGVDYVNNDHRYEAAHEHLKRAYRLALRAGASDKILAEISLWDGISLQENVDLNRTSRNRRAIALYERGIRHTLGSRDVNMIPIRMSLFNSMGVAYHHLGGQGPIEPISYFYYRKARAIYRAHPEMEHRLRRVMAKVESNTGRTVVRGGGLGGAGVNGSGSGIRSYNI